MVAASHMAQMMGLVITGGGVRRPQQWIGSSTISLNDQVVKVIRVPRVRHCVLRTEMSKVKRR
jgi:hypothetical protein